MIVNKIKTLNTRKSSYKNNQIQTNNYKSNTGLSTLQTDKCSFTANPLKLDDAVSTVIKSMLSPNFKEISVPLINPNPELITSFDTLYLRAKNIAERKISFIEVQYSNKKGNGAVPLHTINTKDIPEIIGQDWYPSFLKKETVNKLIDESEKW